MAKKSTNCKPGFLGLEIKTKQIIIIIIKTTDWRINNAVRYSFPPNALIPRTLYIFICFIFHCFNLRDEIDRIDLNYLKLIIHCQQLRCQPNTDSFLQEI